MSNVFRHKDHIKLWNYLVENPMTTKEEAYEELGWKYDVSTKYFRCFACLYADRNEALVESLYDKRKEEIIDGDITGRCVDCPLGWPIRVPEEIREMVMENVGIDINPDRIEIPCDTLFNIWSRLEYDEEYANIRAEIARRIRDLPVRKDIECE